MLEHYPEITRLSFVLDDVQANPWHSYRDDFTDAILGKIDRSCQILCSSAVSKINVCVAGWWRQQLIKLTLDQILSDDKWFVVDGDVIFQSRCEVQNLVPISRTYDADDRWSKMCELYVKGVLGIGQGVMLDQDQPVITSAIPFRYLDRALLSHLRQHVESRFKGDFVDLHLQWFADQTIVADIDPPTRWVMSEWELIECFRRMVQGQILPYKDLGSGYQIDVDISGLDSNSDMFLHSYLRDTSIGPQWFQDRDILVDDNIWQKSLAWYDARERQKLI